MDNDIRAWCRSTGHEFVVVEEGADARVYAVRKAAEVRERPAWAVVISDPRLEEVLSPLGFALTPTDPPHQGNPPTTRSVKYLTPPEAVATTPCHVQQSRDLDRAGGYGADRAAAL